MVMVVFLVEDSGKGKKEMGNQSDKLVTEKEKMEKKNEWHEGKNKIKQKPQIEQTDPLETNDIKIGWMRKRGTKPKKPRTGNEKERGRRGFPNPFPQRLTSAQFRVVYPALTSEREIERERE